MTASGPACGRLHVGPLKTWRSLNHETCGEKVFAEQPQRPGLARYLIHSYECR